ncbi:hypothetical protein HDU86_001770 [Geranomyces michiganensis]|nr:hypothetical protein HDU86_001770 [Geranomyces michiganensis]
MALGCLLRSLLNLLLCSETVFRGHEIFFCVKLCGSIAGWPFRSGIKRLEPGGHPSYLNPENPKTCYQGPRRFPADMQEGLRAMVPSLVGINEIRLYAGYSAIAVFDDLDRAALPAQLHRFSRWQGSGDGDEGEMYALIIRLGKTVTGLAYAFADILKARKSVLILAPPGFGKTTLLREIIRVKLDTVQKLYDAWQAKFGGGYADLLKTNEALQEALRQKEINEAVLAEVHNERIRSRDMEIAACQKEISGRDREIAGRDREIALLKQHIAQAEELHQLKMRVLRTVNRMVIAHPPPALLQRLQV